MDGRGTLFVGAGDFGVYGIDVSSGRGLWMCRSSTSVGAGAWRGVACVYGGGREGVCVCGLHSLLVKEVGGGRGGKGACWGVPGWPGLPLGVGACRGVMGVADACGCVPRVEAKEGG